MIKNVKEKTRLVCVGESSTIHAHGVRNNVLCLGCNSSSTRLTDKIRTSNGQKDDASEYEGRADNISRL